MAPSSTVYQPMHPMSNALHRYPDQNALTSSSCAYANDVLE